MRLKSILAVACAATMMFASCSNDDNSNGFVKGDKEAQLNIAIAFPQAETRTVSDANATADELEITDITVFIFENGVAAPGNGTVIGADKFDEPTNNVYTLKESDRITTTNGTKNIYVGVNLPNSMKGFTSENELSKALTVVPADLQSARGSAMFSVSTVSKYLKESAAAEPTPLDNQVEVEVERLVAKVAVSHGTSSSYTVDGVTYTVDKFAVGQYGTSMFPSKVVKDGKLITPYERTAAPTNLFDVNAAGTAQNQLLSNYVIENATENLLGGEATYAVVRASFAPEKLSRIDGNGDVEQYTTTLTAGDDVWVVRHSGNVYFAVDKTTAEAVAQKLMVPNPNLVATVQEYKGSYCYYYVYLNEDSATKKLEIHRNDFIHITVSGVKGLGASGDTTNGQTPVDPENPNEPIVKSDTYLLVKVTVKSWDYSAKSVELQ